MHFVIIKIFLYSNFFFLLQETYFLRCKGKAPRGRLYDKYCNRKKMLSKEGLVVFKKRKLNETTNQSNQSSASEIEGSSIQQQLLYYKDFEWEEIKTFWKESVNFRRNQMEKDTTQNVSAIVAKWPCYVQPSGHTLVKIFCTFYMKDNCFIQIS